GKESVVTVVKHFAGAGPQKDGLDAHNPWGKEQTPRGEGSKPKSPRLAGEIPSRAAPSRPARRSHAIHTWDDIAPGNEVTPPLTLTLSPQGARGW
ncbi:hypothetical protein ACSZNS_18180, partial [Aeromonas caviae]